MCCNNQLTLYKTIVDVPHILQFDEWTVRLLRIRGQWQFEVDAPRDRRRQRRRSFRRRSLALSVLLGAVRLGGRDSSETRALRSFVRTKIDCLRQKNVHRL